MKRPRSNFDTKYVIFLFLGQRDISTEFFEKKTVSYKRFIVVVLIVDTIYIYIVMVVVVFILDTDELNYIRY